MNATFLEVVDQRPPSNDPSVNLIDPDLRPMRSQELVLGLQHDLGHEMSVGVRYVHKQVDRAIEDQGKLVGSTLEYYITNPGFGLGQQLVPGLADQPKAVRDYDAVEVDFRKRLNDRWSFWGRYWWSRLYGNYSGLASSDEVGIAPRPALPAAAGLPAPAEHPSRRPTHLLTGSGRSGRGAVSAPRPASLRTRPPLFGVVFAMPSVLVTGASRGFGRELAGVYLRRGWTVFPLVRTPQAMAAWAGADRCFPLCADVGVAEAEDAIGRALEARTRALDLLVNNAGQIHKLRWLPETVAEHMEDLFRVHCVGALRCTRAALPFLRRAPRPMVVNVTSRFGSIARSSAGEFRGIYSYSIAKCAQNMLTVCLDRELRKEGIRVWAVHPGRLKTQAAAVDADTGPEVAAERLADWLDAVDRDADCLLYDLMGGGVIPW